MEMILAGVLIQNITLFRQTIDQRPVAGHFHGILVTASNCSRSAQTRILNFCTLDDEAMWSHQCLFELDTSESFCGGCVSGRRSMERLDRL
jgi:hypothetical protein